jgi:hypothetical protein
MSHSLSADDAAEVNIHARTSGRICAKTYGFSK